MPHWTQEALMQNRKIAESVVNAYLDSDEVISQEEHLRMIMELQIRLGCSEKKANEYYGFVIRKKRLKL